MMIEGQQQPPRPPPPPPPPPTRNHRVGGGSGSGRRLIVFAAAISKLCLGSFYLGYRNSSSSNSPPGGRGGNGIENDVDVVAMMDCDHDVVVDDENIVDVSEPSPSMRREVYRRVKERPSTRHGGRGGGGGGGGGGKGEKEDRNEARGGVGNGKLFPDTMRGYAVGALRVSTDEMLRSYDFGVPVKKYDVRKGHGSTTGMGEPPESLILYNTLASVPSDGVLEWDAIHGINGTMATSSVSDAMVNCDTLNVIFTALNNDTDCHLLMGDFESYHINRWVRMPVFDTSNKRKRMLDHSWPLRHAGRITQNKNGVDIFELPDVWDNYARREKGFLLDHFDRMRTFLENVDDVLKDVKDILERRNVVRDNTVVVLTVNSGQSELLINFICAAKSRGFDTGNVLVFPTDEVSYDIAMGLGVATYYDEKNFGKMPMGAARAYGDVIFANMMYAKVLCVLYVSLLGHDVLFQDVDIVWFKDPLTYFHDKSNAAIRDFDIMFQHDGNAQSRYSPFSANSGFYYVRSNKKTSYLFTSLLYHGAIIRKSKSHQQVLVQLLNEHSSMFGLRVKVFDATQTDMFPGGYHYHQNWETMHAIISGKSDAYILHMSWTENKVNKVLFFRQMGEWYARDECIGDGATHLIDGNVADGALIGQCCSVEPIFSCHFRDKPSKVPCPDSPRIDPLKHRSFW